MKIIPPPAINNLDELLNVILHPDKLKTALQQLSDMKAAIVANLDLYTTKDKADDYLIQAQAKHAEAVAAMTEAKALVQQKTKAMAEAKAQIANVQEELKVRVSKHEASMKAREQQVESSEAAMRKRAESLTTRELQVQNQAVEVARLEKKVTVELDKMDQRKALLSAIG